MTETFERDRIGARRSERSLRVRAKLAAMHRIEASEEFALVENTK